MVSAVKVGRAPPARAGPRRDRGRARRPARDGRPLRRRAVARGRDRASSASRSTARRAPTSVSWPPTSVRPSAAVPTCVTCVGPASGPSVWTRPTDWRSSPRPTSSARPRRCATCPRSRSTPRWRARSRTDWPSTRWRWEPPATGPGPCSTAAGGSSPSTRHRHRPHGGRLRPGGERMTDVPGRTGFVLRARPRDATAARVTSSPWRLSSAPSTARRPAGIGRHHRRLRRRPPRAPSPLIELRRHGRGTRI